MAQDSVGVVKQRVRVVVEAEDDAGRRVVSVYINGFLLQEGSVVLGRGDSMDVAYNLRLNVVPVVDFETDPDRPEPAEFKPTRLKEN